VLFRSVLFRALKVRPDLPEIHYNLARYYRIVKDAGEERKALSSGVLPLLKSSDVLTRARMTIEIDTHTRLGELNYREKSYLDAGKEYDNAIRLVESYQSAGLLRAERIFGQPYVDLGDLQYYIQGNLRGALANYAKAEANGYTEPELDFKTGYIHYVGEDLDAALDRFLKAEDALASPRPPANLLFAVGNAFYQKGDYFAAQGYYLRLLDWLLTRKAAIGTLQPEQQPEHRALLEGLVKTENNLGVVMIRLAERSGDRRRKSQALVSLTNASETADVLSRVPETLVRSEAKNLPFLNMRGVLYPLSGFELQIYRVIPKDFATLFY
jgi:tetratricopeptide (TPR) repeat protein